MSKPDQYTYEIEFDGGHWYTFSFAYEWHIFLNGQPYRSSFTCTKRGAKRQAIKAVKELRRRRNMSVVIRGEL